MKTLLITGGSGFLGGYLIRSSIPDYRVVATYRTQKPDIPGVNWAPLDLQDPGEIVHLVRNVNPQTVIHCAAIKDVDKCETDPAQADLINTEATRIMVEAAQEVGARLVFISTDMVYDGIHPPFREDSPPRPLNHYGLSKRRAELEVISKSTDYVIVRAALMYGPPSYLGYSFSEWMRESWERGQVIKLFTDQYRSFISGGNFAEATLELAGTSFVGALNLGGPRSVNRYEFGLRLARCLGADVELIETALVSEVKFEACRPWDVTYDVGFARSLLKTRLIDIEEGIPQAYQSLISQL